MYHRAVCVRGKKTLYRAICAICARTRFYSLYVRRIAHGVLVLQRGARGAHSRNKPIKFQTDLVDVKCVRRRRAAHARARERTPLRTSRTVAAHMRRVRAPASEQRAAANPAIFSSAVRRAHNKRTQHIQTHTTALLADKSRV